MTDRFFQIRLFSSACFGALSLSLLASSALAQDAPIVQPGAPGEAAKSLSAQEAIEIADNSYSPDDVLFMQGMMLHHAQAVEMAGLVKDRTNNREVVDIAGRIDVSQADEIEFMRDWLETRNETAPSLTSDHAGHLVHEMAGMASRAQLDELGAAKATEFDSIFLTLMIAHHEGAVTMVENLLEKAGSAYDLSLIHI